jgi:hypothetical protein
MFDRSRILRVAWNLYRHYARKAGHGSFNRALFAWCLKGSWEAERHPPYEPATSDHLPVARPAVTGPHAARNSEIDGELLSMELSDAPINWSRHRMLGAERTRLSV